MNYLAPYLTLMRPQQWVKNLLIFAPAFFAGTIFLQETIANAVVAVVAFSLVASAVYVLNDLLDCTEDARHPKKCLRPLPSGRVERRHALYLLVVLLVLGFLVASAVPVIWPVLLGYVLLNIVYSRFLKHVPIVDITLVATFYVLRIVAGGIATSTVLSPWIILATFFLALFLVSGKRLGEYERVGRRRSLDRYARESLEAILVGSAVLAIASYSLWTVLVHTSPYAVYTTIPVFAVLFRTLNRLYQKPEEAEAPEIMVFTDSWTFALTILWAFVMLLLFYAN